MENKTNNIVLTIIAVATLLVAIIGASFAYFSATSTSSSQKITTGKLSVIASSSSINEANIKPTTWDNEKMTTNIDNPDIAKLPFTVNTTDTTISSEYDIFLSTIGVALNDEGNISNTPLFGGDLSDIKWVLIKENDKSIVDKGDFTGGDVTNKKLNTNSIEIVPGVDSYKLLFYISDSENLQDKLQNVTISAAVSVEGKQKQ